MTNSKLIQGNIARMTEAVAHIVLQAPSALSLVNGQDSKNKPPIRLSNKCLVGQPRSSPYKDVDRTHDAPCQCVKLPYLRSRGLKAPGALASHMDMVCCDVSTARQPHLQLAVLPPLGCRARPILQPQPINPAGLMQGLCCRCATGQPGPPAAELHCSKCPVLWPI